LHFFAALCSAHFQVPFENSLCNVTAIFDNEDETVFEPALISFRGLKLLG